MSDARMNEIVSIIRELRSRGWNIEQIKHELAKRRAERIPYGGNPEEQEVLNIIKQLLLTGLTFETLVAELEARGVINSPGKATWKGQAH